MTRNEVSVPAAVQQVCEELGVVDDDSSNDNAAKCFKALLSRLLLWSDKETAVRVTAAVLPFVESPLPLNHILSFYTQPETGASGRTMPHHARHSV